MQVSSVKNQGNGRSTAFTTMAVLESCFAIQTGKMEDDLSEQHIEDCATERWKKDLYRLCSDAHFFTYSDWPQTYMDWLVGESGGWTELESCYPHSAAPGPCRYSQGGRGSAAPGPCRYSQGGRGSPGLVCRAEQACEYRGGRVVGMENSWDCNEEEMTDMLLLNPVYQTRFFILYTMVTPKALEMQFKYFMALTPSRSKTFNFIKKFANSESLFAIHRE